MKNPLPKGFNPFKAFPVSDAFPLSRWARHEIFDGEFALVPVRLPPIPPMWRPCERDREIARYLAFINEVRRIDRRRVTDSAIVEILKMAKRMRVAGADLETLRKLSPKDLLSFDEVGSGFSRLLGRLLEVRKDCYPLPRVLRVNYAQIVTMGEMTVDHKVAKRHQLTVRHLAKLLPYEDIWYHGITWAIQHSSDEFGANLGDEIMASSNETTLFEEN